VQLGVYQSTQGTDPIAALGTQFGVQAKYTEQVSHVLLCMCSMA